MSDAVSEPFQPSLQELAEIKKLTREYGEFSRDAVGLGHVLGGGLVFLSAYLIQRQIDLGVGARLLLGAAPFAWILGKEWLRQHYYQFSGMVAQPRRRWESALLLIFTGALALVNLAVAGWVVYRLLQDFSWWLVLSSVVYVAMLLAMPFLVWRYLRAPYEFLCGAFLLTLSTVLLSGTPLTPSGRVGIVYLSVVYLLRLPAMLVALVMVLVGFVEHMEFLKLRREIRARKEAA